MYCALLLGSQPRYPYCDEPALDVTIQAQILGGNRLKERELSIIFITHDLGVVANMADHCCYMPARLSVRYGGGFSTSLRIHTWALRSMPDLETKDSGSYSRYSAQHDLYPKGDALPS